MIKKTLSYQIELIKLNPTIKKSLRKTIKIFLHVIRFINKVIYDNKDDILSLKNKTEQYDYIEKLIHSTKHTKAKYPEFDTLFPYLPAYLRRSAVSRSLGHMSSYFSNLDNYNDKRYNAISNGKKFKEKEPSLNLNPNIMPTFFKNNMYKPTKDGFIYIKLYDKNEWKYFKIKLKKNDYEYLNKVTGKRNNPSLEFKNNKFYIRFSFENEINLSELKPVKDRLIMAVDLGINTHATCSIMKSDGTVIARKFITNATDKTTLNHLLNKKRILQRKSGRWDYAPLTHIQNKINNVNKNIENYVVHNVIKTALDYKVDVIVFERLSSNFKGKSFMKANYWRKKHIIKKICNKIHLYNIRYSTVNCRYSSRLAFDGSGYVKRGKEIKKPYSRKKNKVNVNYSICMFPNKKFYNCDLNASYNIGARYFYREFYKEKNIDLDKSITEVTLNDLKNLVI